MCLALDEFDTKDKPSNLKNHKKVLPESI